MSDIHWHSDMIELAYKDRGVMVVVVGNELCDPSSNPQSGIYNCLPPDRIWHKVFL